MNKLLSLPYLSLLVVIGLTGCNHVTSSNSSTNNRATDKLTPTILAQPKPTIAVQTVIGDYVSEGYHKRSQGYDWVAVMVRADDKDKDKINISVRARSDIKKPTCQFEGEATLMGQDQAHGVVFQAPVNNSTAFFQFKDNALGERELIVDSQDKYALNYYCSGGGSIVGVYQKLKGNLELN